MIFPLSSGPAWRTTTRRFASRRCGRWRRVSGAERLGVGNAGNASGWWGKDGNLWWNWRYVGNMLLLYYITLSGWWFGTFHFLFFHNVVGIIILTDELIYFKMVIAPSTSIYYTLYSYTHYTLWIPLGLKNGWTIYGKNDSELMGNSPINEGFSN